MGTKPEETPVKKTEADETKLADANKAGSQTENEKIMTRLSALNKEFPDRPKFVNEQLALGHDVQAAKADLADILIKENAALSAQNDEGGGGTKPIEGVIPSDDQTTLPPDQGGGGPHPFEKLCAEIQKNEKVSEGKARILAGRRNQKLSDEYIVWKNADNKRKAGAV